MHITQIEIDNFKSFGRRTRIPFNPGFTVISGPNGSGKSNIIDSILFALSLSTSRSLRAERLTDLINLNSGRNTAEVEISFSDGTVIKRRIKRTESTYYNYLYLNGKSCRQGDLLDFLAGNGIVPHGYNVVMQGDINRIIEMSDLERRRIIDEIAGVAEFDSKKALAYEELGRVRDHINEESAHLEELQARLNLLERQREQAIRFRTLQDDLKQYTLCRSAAVLAQKEAEQSALEEGITGDRASLKQIEDDISWTSHERDFVREDIARIDREITARTGSEYMALVSRIAEAKAAIDAYERSITRAEQEKSVNTGRLSDIFTSVKRQEERLAEKEGEIRDLMIDRTNLSMTVAAATKEQTRIQKDIDDRSRELQDDEDRLRTLREQVSGLKDTRGDLVREQDLLIERSRIRSAEENRIQSLVAAAGREIRERREKAVILEQEVEQTRERKKGCDRLVASLDTGLYAKREAHEILQKTIRDLRQEIVRKEAHQQAQGRYGRALEAVLGMDGVYGTIADLATCDPEYAMALNIAAGGKLHFVVVEHDQIAADAIRFLKENKLGRVTFLPLNKLRAKPHPSLPAGDDVIGFATDLLRYDPRYDDAFRVVFGSTLVIDSLDHARRRMGEFRMVTLDGSLLEKSGSMTGGSAKQEISGFGRSSEDELKQLGLRLSGLMAEERSLSDDLVSVSAERDRVQQERLAVESDLLRLQTMAESLEQAIASQEAECASFREQIAENSNGNGGNGGDLAAIEQRIASLNEEISGMQSEISEISGRLEETGIPVLFEQLDQASKNLAESERRLKNKENDIGESQRERSYIEKAIGEQREEMERVRDQNSRLDDEITRLRADIQNKKDEIKSVQEEVDRMTLEIADLQEERTGQADKAEEFELQVRELNGKKERVLVRIESLEEKIRSLLDEIESLQGEAGDTKTDLSLEEIDSRLADTRTAIDTLGAVNMQAIEEYDLVDATAKERKDRLAVLERELEDIHERIEFFARKKYEAFMAAFTAIDQNFREIFARLTMGTGGLHLENDEDPFAGGLSFAVQPRDKKVHLLAALSGGEKSLTTLAFIFSIQKYIPAPFYAFDEVDMNLDGANVERIAEMIKSLSGSSQFINISLRKPMIDAADRIIGVTIRPDKSTLVTGVSMDD